MISKILAATGIALFFTLPGMAAAEKPRGVVECADLHWSAQVLAANPDIALACQGVYEKDGVLYAKASIEVIRVQGSTLRFRTLLNDGSKGGRRSVKLSSGWTVKIADRYYRAADLVEGQRLNIYLPEDRFALTVLGSNDTNTAPIEKVED